MNGRQKGMVQIWDVVGFDEVGDLQKIPKEVITTMKTYCESGTFQRGQEAVSGDASIASFKVRLVICILPRAGTFTPVGSKIPKARLLRRAVSPAPCQT